MKKEIEFQVMYTPWTIDTYVTFDTERWEEMEIGAYNEEHGTKYGYDHFEWEYDHKGFVKQLAENWLYLVPKNIIDDVILGIEADGEPWSPREYNFSTDNMNVKFVVDVEKLAAYVDANRDHYDAEKIKSGDGFMWLGDEEQTMLEYYLAQKSVGEYTAEDYEDDQRDLLDGNGQIGEFVTMNVK